MPLARSGQARGRSPPANPKPTPRRGRGSSVGAVPTRRRHGDRSRSRSLHDYGPRPGPSPAVRFDVPVAGGREVSSVDVHGERTSFFVAQGVDGRYSTESVRGRFESIDQPMNALDASSPQRPSPFEEEEHVGSSASAQTPHPDCPQHLAFRGLPCKEQHAAEPASAQTLHKQDSLSLKDVHYPTTMEVSSQHHSIEASPPPGPSLSSSPIWIQLNFVWGMTFYTIKDRSRYFHTFPHVGGPFQSKGKANKAIARYLNGQKDPTMGRGLSKVDKLIQQTRYFPDGTKKRLRAGQPIDKRRDANYQLAQAVLYKYNDHHNLFGDRAYEVIDVLDKPSCWEEENIRNYIHMNFTAKTKVSDGDTDSDNLFFAEVTYVTGEDDKLTVNCCCVVESFDNGPCLGCESSVKHPIDGNAYTGGRMSASYSLPFGPGWSYAENSDEEVERLRFLFGGAEATAGVPPEA